MNLLQNLSPNQISYVEDLYRFACPDCKVQIDKTGLHIYVNPYALWQTWVSFMYEVSGTKASDKSGEPVNKAGQAETVVCSMKFKL